MSSLSSLSKVPLLVLLGVLFGAQDRLPADLTGPNIVLFFVDDLGWQDTSVPFWEDTTAFNRRYRTPNMERLAAEGTKFTQAYATPVCSPTRVSLMTGMNAARHRVTNWTLYPDQLQPMEINHQTLSFPHWNVNGMTPDSNVQWAAYATTFPQILQEHGYRTIHAGKAHLGAISTPAEDPLNIGFEINIAGHAAGAPQSYYGVDNFGNNGDNPDSPWPVPGLEEYHGEDVFLTEALTRKALQAVDQAIAENHPFFLYMSLYAVHTPIMGDPRFVQHYYDLGLDSTEAQYASMVEAMDKSLGDILQVVDAAGIAQQTAVLFMSDNGGLSAVARGGEPHTHNFPLSSGKGSIHEGGIREPMIVKWPGQVQSGHTDHRYLIIEDFFPTILDIAGIDDYQTVQTVDGHSFLDYLRHPGRQQQDRPLFWHYPNEWGPSGPGIGAFSAVRQGKWKLIYYHEDESFELFDLERDISESENLFSLNPTVVKKLAILLTDHLKKVNAQMPSHRVSGNPVSWPSEKV